MHLPMLGGGSATHVVIQGEVKRTAQNCFPLPPEAETRILAGQPLDGLRNLSEPGNAGVCPCPPLTTNRGSAAS